MAARPSCDDQFRIVTHVRILEVRMDVTSLLPLTTPRLFHLVALVRAGARFERGQLVERAEAVAA